MTFEQIREEVRRRLQEVSATFWTDDEIDEAIHLGEDEMADATEWYERYQYIDTLPHRPYYDLRSVIRFPFLVAGPAYNETTSRWLIPHALSDFDSSDRRWEERYAEPQYQMVRGLWWMGYWPQAPAGGSVIKQYYKSLPRHMSATTDEPGFHRTFHYGLVEFAICDLLSQDAETSLALAAWKVYKGYEDGLGAYVNGRSAIPTLHGNRSSAEP